MTKLTTERLEYYAALPTQPAERKEIFMYEVRCVARQILAYEQAAKNPVAEMGAARTPLYAAPVLPKQPEHSRQHFESLCNQFWNWAEFDEINQDEEPRLEWNGSNYTNRVTAALWKMYQAAPAQPVIPGQLTQRMAEEKALSLGAALCDEEAEVFSDGWNACRAEMLKAQPVSEPYKLISVKDDTPTESGDYWCYLGKDFEGPTKYLVVHFDVRHHEFQDHRVTHWMRLPAEPEQEA